ncbi:MAG: BamA/TamA family outer membrane protein [Bacteroidales bacterium]|nr:BamA/TamA family outer membrane protein [Bacteroidales bacterium]MBN2747989.1 BamA/TamA family outer membrane protein [Bacteroidales bacterium]
MLPASKKWVTTALALCFLALNALGQQVHFIAKDAPKPMRLSAPRALLANSLQADSLIVAHCLPQLFAKGYLGVTIDSARLQLPIAIYGALNGKYKWGQVSLSSTAAALSRNSRSGLRYLSRRVVSPLGLTQGVERILSYMENNGYPFGSVWFDSVTLGNSCITGKLNASTGPYITFDTLVVKGNIRVKPSFLSAFVRIRNGYAYSEQSVQQAEPLLKTLPWATVIRPPEVEFVPHKARVYIYLEKRRASRFSGVAGFNVDPETNKLQLTGDINLKLVNLLARGETLGLLWQAPGEGAQRLDLTVRLPYIRGWQFGLDGRFSLYRRDSTYMNVNPVLRANFYINGYSQLSVGVDMRKSIVLQKQVTSTLNGYTTTLYGAYYQFDNRGSNPLPTRGLWVDLAAKAGTRKVDVLPLPTSTTLFEPELRLEVLLPLFKERLVLKGTGGYKQLLLLKGDAESFQQNELYLVGGEGSIRGFDQGAIPVSAIAMASAEVHYRPVSVIGVFAFADMARLRTVSQSHFSDVPVNGVGFGLNLVAGSGILKVSYALGNGLGQTYKLRNARVHIGWEASF